MQTQRGRGEHRARRRSPRTASSAASSHIFAGGYAAGYYSYKWAEVLSADAFAAFEEAGLDDAGRRAATGRRFRDTVLALGGSRHPMEVFKEFRGREPSTRPCSSRRGSFDWYSQGKIAAWANWPLSIRR